MKKYLINFFKCYFVTRSEYIAYMEVNKKLLDLHTKQKVEFLEYMQANYRLVNIMEKQIENLTEEKNDYKTFIEELNKASGT